MAEVTQEQCFAQHKELNDSINALRVDIAGIPDKILEKSEERFASKLVERIVYGMCVFILVAFLGAIVGLVVYAR